MNDFMKGRNGADELTIVMGLAGIVIAMIGSIARIQWLSWIAIAVIVILHIWKRNMLLSIAGGTAIYMALLQLVFV